MEQQQRPHRQVPVAGIVLIVIGGLFLLQTTGVLRWGVWVNLIRFWPVLLIAFGLNLWLGRRRPWFTAFTIAVTLLAVAGAAIAFDVTDVDENLGGTLSIEVIFGSAERNYASQQFDGGDASSIFGSAEIDLREAIHPGGTVRVELNAVFGSVEVRVPDEWDVRIDGTPVLGSVDDNRTTKTAPDGAPVLEIEANAVFGSVTIRN